MLPRILATLIAVLLPTMVWAQTETLDRCRAACVGYAGGRIDSMGFKLCLRDVCKITDALEDTADGYSPAAQDLISEQIQAACPSGSGTMAPAGAVERDFDGDGKADLLLSHEGISCEPAGRSQFCGAQVCSLMIYLVRDETLELVFDGLGKVVAIDEGTPPTVTVMAHGGSTSDLQWTGEDFERP